MKSQYFIILLIIWFSIISGCASVKDLFKPTPIGPPFELEEKNDSQNVTIYLYRPWRFGSGLASPLITINGEEILILRNGGYTRINATIGQYVLETKHSEYWVEGMEGHLLLNSKPNQTYFVRVLPSTGLGTTDFELSVLDEQEALKEISDTFYLNPKKMQYQYDVKYDSERKAGNHSVESKNETKKLKDRSGPGRFLLELVIYAGIMIIVLL